jgi:FlaA1/EpsC-like NDP-sugar epimerase
MEQNILNKFNMSGRTVLVTGAGGLLGKQFHWRWRRLARV